MVINNKEAINLIKREISQLDTYIKTYNESLNSIQNKVALYNASIKDYKDKQEKLRETLQVLKHDKE